MTGYDDYLDRITDEHNTGCVPRAYECNEDKVPAWTCEDCNNKDCDHYWEFNED